MGGPRDTNNSTTGTVGGLGSGKIMSVHWSKEWPGEDEACSTLYDSHHKCYDESFPVECRKSNHDYLDVPDNDSST